MVMACEHLRYDNNYIGNGMGLHMMAKSSANVGPTLGQPLAHCRAIRASIILVGIW